MADIHVLDGDGTNYRIVFHFPVPDNSNAVGVSYREALVNSGLGGSTNLPDGDGTGGTISAAEKTQIEAGEVYEHAKSFNIGSGGTEPAQIQASLRQWYASELLGQQPLVKDKLEYYGHTESAA